MIPSVSALSVVAARSIDPTDHGSNLGVVAGLAVAILAFIGLLVFFITRWGRETPDAGAGPAAAGRPGAGTAADPVPESVSEPVSESEAASGSGPDR